MSERLPDWEQRLAATLAAAFDQPYAEGRHDCLLFCGRAVEAVTGEDLHSVHRGRYRTRLGAVRRLRKLGFRSPAAFLDAHFPERPVSHARRGDLVLDNEGIPGVCMGDFALTIAASAEREGLFRVPRAQWVKAWAIGAEAEGAA